jgi:hypothetical protein
MRAGSKQLALANSIPEQISREGSIGKESAVIYVRPLHEPFDSSVDEGSVPGEPPE